MTLIPRTEVRILLVQKPTKRVVLNDGENFDWDGNPLFDLYRKHATAGLPRAEAIEQAGKESGWLLKQVIDSDGRVFETRREELIRKYRWMP